MNIKRDALAYSIKQIDVQRLSYHIYIRTLKEQAESANANIKLLTHKIRDAAYIPTSIPQFKHFTVY